MTQVKRLLYYLKGGFLALVREATRLGVLQNAAMIENEALADQVRQT